MVQFITRSAPIPNQNQRYIDKFADEFGSGIAKGFQQRQADDKASKLRGQSDAAMKKSYGVDLSGLDAETRKEAVKAIFKDEVEKSKHKRETRINSFIETGVMEPENDSSFGRGASNQLTQGGLQGIPDNQNQQFNEMFAQKMLPKFHEDFGFTPNEEQTQKLYQKALSEAGMQGGNPGQQQPGQPSAPMQGNQQTPMNAPAQGATSGPPQSTEPEPKKSTSKDYLDKAARANSMGQKTLGDAHRAQAKILALEEDKVEKKASVQKAFDELVKLISDGNLGLVNSWSSPKGRADAKKFETLTLKLEGLYRDMSTKGHLTQQQFDAIMKSLPKPGNMDETNLAMLDGVAINLDLDRSMLKQIHGLDASSTTTGEKASDFWK